MDNEFFSNQDETNDNTIVENEGNFDENRYAFTSQPINESDWEWDDVDLFSDFEDDSIFNESENLFKEAKQAYNKVDDKLLVFIDNFVINQNNAAKQKKFLKAVFFWFTMISFALIVLTPIIFLVVLILADVQEYYVIFGSIVAALVEVLATVIVLPKIVAEYLFNKEEENTYIKIVEIMQEYSETIHGYDMQHDQ